LDIRESRDGAILSVKASPGAQKSAIAGELGGALKIKVAARPEKGKANAELENFLAGVFGISKSSVEVMAGGRSRQKQVLLRGVAKTAAESALENILKKKREDR
jgi:uncharacterized protein (TIGR00251 family)